MTKPRLIIEVEKGCVVAVYCDQRLELDFLILDHDTGEDNTNLWEVEVDPGAVEANWPC